MFLPALYNILICIRRCILVTNKASDEIHRADNLQGDEAPRHFFSTDGEEIIISNAYEDDLLYTMEIMLID